MLLFTYRANRARARAHVVVEKSDIGAAECVREVRSTGTIMRPYNVA